MANYAEVLIPPLDQGYTYEVPAALLPTVKVGSALHVPLGRRKTWGYVVNMASSLPDHLKGVKIRACSDTETPRRVFDQRQIEFFEWVAKYYGCHLSNVFDVAIPKYAAPKLEKTVKILQEKFEARGKLQRDILELVSDAGGVLSYSQLLRHFRGAGPAVKRLADQEVVQVEVQDNCSRYYENREVPKWAKTSVVLDENQSVLVEKIVTSVRAKCFEPFLLHGVTGSGKTELYLEAIEAALAKGQSALVLVPEIALTPQLIDRFTARLGTNIATLHSGMSNGARWDAWRALLESRTQVAVGARSAVFAPMHNLGLIVVDEEHDTSYKQSEGLRYNARDLALVRAKLESCPVVLGSATPSLESYYNAIQKRYAYLPLAARHNSGSEVELEIIDMNRRKPWDMAAKYISKDLSSAIENALAEKEQVFVLYNRRGFASYMQCERCEEVLSCPNCSVTFTYHQSAHILRCHYCSLESVPPQMCSVCVGETPASYVERGAGTEKVFDELTTLFPEARIDRLDRDTVGSIQEYQRVLNSVRDGETQILVGTQMIAKGHDLPGVTLVGVVDCDVGLHMPDFRASERVFQLLTQVAGRAGRGERKGKVILQTRVPKHPSLEFTRKKDFRAFAADELQKRKLLSYPPFARVLRVVVSAEDLADAEQAAQLLGDASRNIVTQEKLQVSILGPCAAPLAKLRTHWRWHLLCKSARVGELHAIIYGLQARCQFGKRVRLTFDLDPQDLL